MLTELTETDPSARYTVEYKSIILDIVEKYKTEQRVREAFRLERGEERNVESYPPGLLFRFRKCTGL